MEVRVKVKKWGNYSEGDTLDIANQTTALACIKVGNVEAISDEAKPKAKAKK
jgi:hypothetical protein